jgi:hypothetical protein
VVHHGVTPGSTWFGHQSYRRHRDIVVPPVIYNPVVRQAQQCKGYVGKEQKNQCFKYLLQNKLFSGKIRVVNISSTDTISKLVVTLRWSLQKPLITNNEKLFFFLHVQNVSKGCVNDADYATGISPPANMDFRTAPLQFETKTILQLPPERFAGKVGEFAIFAGVICTNCPHRTLYWMESFNGLAGRSWLVTVKLDNYQLQNYEVKKWSEEFIHSEPHFLAHFRGNTMDRSYTAFQFEKLASQVDSVAFPLQEVCW